LNGFGCVKCRGEYALTTERFILFSNEKHNNKYDYSLSIYENMRVKINIICKDHGIFKQTPGNHLKGCGCPSCGGVKIPTTEEYILNANKLHNSKYDYSLTEYKNAKTKVKIICLTHGIFEQEPGNHIQGQGCPICNDSIGEKEVRNFLISNDIKFIPQHTFENCKNKKILSFDFYLPDYNICIEYDGIQHFEPIEHFGGQPELEIRKHLDKIKTDYCKNNNIKLIRIRYNENILDNLNSHFQKKETQYL